MNAVGAGTVSFRNPRFLTYGALLTAVGVVVPFFFHQFGMAGKVFLPMHFPVLIAGFLLGPLGGMMVGFLCPTVSALLTGMPPLPYLSVMVPELMTYGGVSGALYRWSKRNIWMALLGAMAAGRAVLGLTGWVMAHLLDIHLTPVAFMTGAMVTGLPGIVGQLILIPLLMWRLRPLR